MATPILPILRLQEAAESSIPLNPGLTPARPVVRLHHGPFRDRPEIWSLVPIDDALPMKQKSLFGEAEDWLADEMERCSAEPRIVLIDASIVHDIDLAKIIETLARHRVVAWLTTNVPLGLDVIAALARHEELARVTVVLPTLD